MSEHPSSRQPPDSGARKSDSQLRLVRTDDEVIIPDNAEPTDDSPTIISKNHHQQLAEEAVTAQAPEMPAGKNLRGQRLAHFELVEPIGVGGMAAVMRARDTQLDRTVALKILPPEMAADPENIRRFHQEARAAAKLDHDAIARVFFCGEDKRLHFIAFEFVEGENVRTLIDRKGPFPVAEAVRYILQVATGLEHATERGVVHRDIKPSNIIISPNGRAKLVDMGLARSLEPHGDKALTQSGVTLGTFDYISPEQALEPREADARSDIYSLGCTFYHMLTGQPPVPEGTAAKKLKHHQDVAPIDPRQLNPLIPDEVAAILMRMMAKQPKDRYQRPVHLVHHLMQIAQKVGAATDVPEGVMFLDAPLPGAPCLRPLLTISVAVLALGFLLMLLSLVPPQPNAPPRPPGPPAPINPGDNLVTPRDPTKPTPPGVVASAPVSTRDQLQAVLEDKQRGEQPINLEPISLGETGLVFSGDKRARLVLQSRHQHEPATLRFQYQPSAEDHAAGLTIDGGTVEFRNLRFEVQLPFLQTPSIPVAMVAVRGGANVRFVGCTFVQKEVPFVPFLPPAGAPRDARMPLASVRVENTNGPSETRQRPVVQFDECYWERGQAAVAVHGPARISVANGAFGPHACLFHLQEESKNFATDLALSRCSAFVVQGPVLRLDGAHTCQLRVANSIFSCPGSSSPETTRDEIQFIRQTDSKDPLVRYEGVHNCFHNLSALWVFPGENGNRIKANIDELTMTNPRGKDEESFVTLSSPWFSKEPLALLKAQKSIQAFQLRHDIPELRMLDGKPIGIETLLSVAMPPLPLLPSNPGPVVGEIVLKPNEKVIDPEATDSTPNVYRSLSSANLQPGDVVFLKHGKKSRDHEIRTLNLEDPKTALTFKPYPGHHPVLVLPEKTQLRDATLFKLFDGKLHFENLEFHLEPDQPEFKAQSVVALASNGSVSFKNCVITLRQTDSKTRLSAVTFLDPDDVTKMSMMSNRSQAQVHLTGCMVRGEGDLVTVRGTRPFELKLDNTILALGGSALLVQAGNKDVPAETPIYVKMSHVSAFLTEPLITLRAGKNPKGLGLTRCDPVRDSLFVSLADKPLILLDGIEATEDTFKQFVDWKGEKNAYVGFERLLDFFRPDEPLPSLTLETDAWRRVEMDARSSRARFLNMPGLQLRPFSLQEPEKFEPKAEFREELMSYGAILDPRILPRYTAPRTDAADRAASAP